MTSSISQAKALFTANSGFLQGYKQHKQYASAEAYEDWHQQWDKVVTWAFEHLNGDDFIKELRRQNTRSYLYDFDFAEQHRMCTWADWMVRGRPIIYKAVFTCNQLVVSSILKTKEGRASLNQSYPIEIEELSSDYPIHTAIRVCTLCKAFEEEPHSPTSLSESELRTEKNPPSFVKAFSILRELVSYKANLNQENFDGQTPLYCATQTKMSELVDFLLEKGALSVKISCSTDCLTDEELLFLFERYEVLRAKIVQIILLATPLPHSLILITTHYV